MKIVLFIVLAIAICISAQTENPECSDLRNKIRALRATFKDGELASVEAKVNEYKTRMDAMACSKTIIPVTRETEDKECANIRQKIRTARATISDPVEVTNKVQGYIKQLDGLKCAKRSIPLPERRNEPKECEGLRAKIRQVRAVATAADKETSDKKVAEYKAKMDQIKCVNRPRSTPENPECQNLRAKIRLMRANFQPGQLREVENKVKEYTERLKTLKCRQIIRPVNRDTENPRCKIVRNRINVARLTIRNEKELAKKIASFKKELDSLKCAKDAVVPDERKNEPAECSDLRAKIRALRAKTTSADKETAEKKVNEYKKRMDKLKCVQLPRRQNRRCVVTGCNGELCSERDQMSPCWSKPEFKCFAKHAKCGNFGSNGACGWRKTAEFYTCSGEKRNN
jgi:hypothetical protein